MKVAVTGHTKGIGKSIFDYFKNKGLEVVGFSRSTGFDISNEEDRNRILEMSKDCDIFVNNAYKDYDNSQKILLDKVFNLWNNQEKVIINISTRWTYTTHPYSLTKLSADHFCEKHKQDKVYLINLKPGMIDTDRVRDIEGDRMDPSDVVNVIDFILSNKNKFRVHSITFGR